MLHDVLFGVDLALAGFYGLCYCSVGVSPCSGIHSLWCTPELGESSFPSFADAQCLINKSGLTSTPLESMQGLVPQSSSEQAEESEAQSSPVPLLTGKVLASYIMRSHW